MEIDESYADDFLFFLANVHGLFFPFLTVRAQLPSTNTGVLDMSLQTPSDVKVKEEEPVEVDSSPPGSPESISSRSDYSQESAGRPKVRPAKLRIQQLGQHDLRPLVFLLCKCSQHLY